MGGAPGVVNNQSMNASSSNGGLINSSASQSVLNDPSDEAATKPEKKKHENVSPELAPLPQRGGETLKINNEFI
jgi:hypothetical protein